MKIELLLLKIEKQFDQHNASDNDEQDDGASPSHQEPPFDADRICLIDHHISLKWFFKVKIIVFHEFGFNVVALIDSRFEMNHI